MRLQLIVALATVASPAIADPGAEATVRVYTDDDDMTVVSPSVRAETAIGETTVEAEAAADAITGASIDVVTSASPRSIIERRLELGLGAARPVNRAETLVITATARASHENDHDGVRAGAGARLDLLDRQVTVDARYLVGRDAIGTVLDPTFARTRVLHQASASLSVVVDPRTLVDLLIEGTWSSGYHASPYRRVPVMEPAWPTPTWLDEATPETRRSIAGATRLRRALGAAWFATVGYRAYADDWAMSSHTLSVDARHQLHERVLAGVSLRGYLQDAAGFYRATYTDMPAWRTRDRTLGPMRTLFGSLTADAAVGERWHLLAAAGVLASWFPEFPLQSDRHALVLTLSLSFAFGGDE